MSSQGILSGLIILVINTVHTKEFTAVAEISIPTIFPFYKGNIVTISNWILYCIEYSEKHIKSPVRNKITQFVHVK